MVSIIIAAYNEQNRIRGSLFTIYGFVKERNISHEIIVVNDGSTDKTKDVLSGLFAELPTLKIINYDTNKGKGFALRAGILASRGRFVLLSDADLSTPIEEITVLLSFIEAKTYDIAIGSRALPLSKIIKRQPWWRQGMGKIFNKIVKMVILQDFHDTQCGFKVFEGTIAKELFAELRTDRFAFDVEILARAKKKKYRIIEVPVRWLNSNHSTVNPFFDSLIMIKDIIKIRLTLGNLENL